MRSFAGTKYWLVGASEGLGRALAHRLSAVGAELILSGRRAGPLQELAQTLPGRARAVPVDISDRAAVEEAAAQAGEIDGVIQMAGVYEPIAVGDWDAAAVEQMCDINLTGTARVVGAVLPGMVARGRGHIVLTGSLSGFRGLPGTIGYGASKAGVMYLAESLHADLRGTGVDVQLVNPGFIRTRLTDKNSFPMPFIMEPDKGARIIMDHLHSDGFARNFPTAFSLMFRGAQFLPDWLYYRLLR